MKLPKLFFVFLIIAQAVITAGHFLLYQALIFFFPFFARHWLASLIALMALSVSFLAASVFDFKSENEFLRGIYIIASVWVPTWFYLLLAAALSSILYLLDPGIALTAIATPIFLMAAVVVVYGIVNARYVRIVRFTAKLPNLPEYWKGKTAVLASDLHLGHILRASFAAALVSRINALKPDMVLIPGDFFDGVHTDFPGLAAPFKNLRVKHGTYFCSGNHEQFAGMENCERALRDIGITILDNNKTEIAGLQIAGLGYAARQTDADIASALNSLSLDPHRPSILLKHVPDKIPAVAAAGINLMLSGHSHDGQIWPGSLVTNKVWKGFGYGLKKFGQILVYTSSGAGTWGPPVRTFTKAEIVQITFE